MTKQLSHVDDQGHARMVDVGDKTPTTRTATAEGRVKISPELQDAIRRDDVAKGNVLETARLAGIQAAKRTDELIPLCHTLPLEHVGLELSLEEGAVVIRATARVTAKTGVEMEALTAVSVAALCVFDMGKAVDPHMEIGHIRVIEKQGGRRDMKRKDEPVGNDGRTGGGGETP